jgi:hypothetical protein
MQGAVKRLTDINSALITLQACMILLFLWQLLSLVYPIPYFKLFSGMLCCHVVTRKKFYLVPSSLSIFQESRKDSWPNLTSCDAEAISQASDTLGNSMMVAGVVGVPVFFILLLTIGTSQDTFSDLSSILEQVASYQLIGALRHFQLLSLLFNHVFGCLNTLSEHAPIFSSTCVVPNCWLQSVQCTLGA